MVVLKHTCPVLDALLTDGCPGGLSFLDLGGLMTASTNGVAEMMSNSRDLSLNEAPPPLSCRAFFFYLSEFCVC